MVRIADAHTDYAPFQILEHAKGRLYDHVDLDRLEQGGVALQVFAIWVPPECPDKIVCGQKEINCLLDFIKDSCGRVKLCTCASDLDDDTYIHAIISIESGESIDCRPERIPHVYELGARLLSLTWNEENPFASGCMADGGLKPDGIAAIQELNRLKMALDLSHINEQGFWEAAELYIHAPCATHSCAYDLVPCPRNLKKDQIASIIERRGYIGINFYTEFLKGRYASIGDIIAHIDFMLANGGEDAVGLGSDFCGIQYTPEGMDSSADFQKIPDALARLGYSDTLINKICYGNLYDYILKFL